MELRDFYRSFASWMGGQHLFVAYPKIGSVHVSKQYLLGISFLEVDSNVIGEEKGLTVRVRLKASVNLNSGHAFVFKSLTGEPCNLLSVSKRRTLIETERCQVIKTLERFSKSDDEVEKHLNLVLTRLLQEVKSGEVEEERLIEAMIEVLDGIHLEGEKVGYCVGVDDFEWIEVYPLEVGGLRAAYVRYANPAGGAKGITLEKEVRKIEEFVEKVKDGSLEEEALEDYLRKWRRFTGTGSLSLEAYSKHLNLN